MTFATIFKSIGHGLAVAAGVEHSIAPVLKLIPIVGQYVQPVDDIITRIQNGIKVVETVSPQGGGDLKSASVQADFAAGLDLTNSLLALEGKRMAYDQASLSDFINAQVAAYNAGAKLKASFKIVDLPK